MDAIKVIKNKYSQNFLKSNILVNNLIRQKIQVNSDDVFIDIGVGKGIITEELAKYAKSVIGFEIDRDLVAEFRNQNKFANVKLIGEDFLKYDIESFGPVKVFANIPFFLTADIVRKLTLENTNVSEAYLLMEKQAAWRFIGQPYKNNSILSILIRTFYDIRMLYNFKKTDFTPVPDADVVLTYFKTRNTDIQFRSLYFDFVSYLFNLRRANIKIALTRLFTYEQIKRLAKNIDFKLVAKASDLTVEQWIKMYKYFLTMPKEKHIPIVGEFAKIMRHQRKLNKKTVILYTKERS